MCVSPPWRGNRLYISEFIEYEPGMTLAHRPAALTPLDAALAAVLDGLEPVAVREIPLAEALGCIAAEMAPLQALPASDLAATDGWAFHSGDLVGASPWSPLLLTAAPVWVEA